MTEILDNKELTEKLGALTEFVNEKLDIDAMNSNSSTGGGLDSNGIRTVIDTYIDGTSGYRIWSDGYCEQWGYIAPSTGQDYVVTLLKTMKDIYYHVSVTHSLWNTTASWNKITSAITNKLTTGFTMYACSISEAPYGNVWKASGYLASDQY